MKLKRQAWIDIAKGLAILAVVIGHSASDIGIDKHYFYWFHMPAFFIISGFLFNPPNNFTGLKEWGIKRSKQLLIPYITFLLLITFFRYLFIEKENYHWYINDFLHAVAGGQSITSPAYVTMWFITCMLTTQILAALIFTFIKPQSIRFAIIVIFYFLAHFDSWLSIKHEIHVPGNIDVSLLAITYLYIGIIMRSLLEKLSKRYIYIFISISTVLSLIFILLNQAGILNYQLDMYRKAYHSISFDILIPLSFTVVLFVLSYIFTKIGFFKRTFSSLGETSLTIMYLHIPIKLSIETFLGKGFYIEIILILLGVLLPWLITKFLLNHFYTTRYFFLGEISTKSIKQPQLKEKSLS